MYSGRSTKGRNSTQHSAWGVGQGKEGMEGMEGSRVKGNGEGNNGTEKAEQSDLVV